MSQETDATGLRVEPKKWILEDTVSVFAGALGGFGAAGFCMAAVKCLELIGIMALTPVVFTAISVPLVIIGAAVGLKAVLMQKEEKVLEIQERELTQVQREKTISPEITIENHAFKTDLGKNLLGRTSPSVENNRVR